MLTPTEKVSETLISEAIKIDASSNTNTHFMQKTHEDSVFFKGTVRQRWLEGSFDDLNFWNDLSGQVDEMIGELSEWPVTRGKGFSYIPLKDLLENLGIPLQQAYDTFQVFKFRDFKGSWSDSMTTFGFVFPHEYEGAVPEWRQKIGFTCEVVSPHGHEFIIEFFKITKDWFS